MNDGQNVIKPVYVIPYEHISYRHTDNSVHFGMYFVMDCELDCFLFLSTNTILSRGDAISDRVWFGNFLHAFTFNWV